MGHFVYAAKAFDVLERLDPDPEYWEGKRGACIGHNYDPYEYIHTCVRYVRCTALCIFLLFTYVNATSFI